MVVSARRAESANIHSLLRELSTMAGANAGNQLVQAFGRAAARGIHDEIRFQRRLVRGRYAGELIDVPSPRPLIEPLHVSRLANLEWTFAIDFDEVRWANDPSCELAIFPQGSDQCHDRDPTSFQEELGDLCDSANILFAIRRGESEIAAKARSNVVAIQYDDRSA
jgi:hypothetical protein